MEDREYIELLVKHEKEMREEHIRHERELREVFDEHAKDLQAQYRSALQNALELQAREYERRLEMLNNEYVRADAVQRDYLRAADYHTFVSGYHETIKVVLQRLDEAKGASARTVLLVTIGLTVLVILMKFVPVGFGH